MTFAEYVEQHRSALLRFARVLIGDGGPAEDIVQTVLARACDQWGRVGRANHPHAYVRRMVVNEYLSWRRRWHRVVPMARLDDLLPRTPDYAERHAAHADLLRLVAMLPRKQRATVVLRYYEDLDDDEIAATLGCGASTVRSNLARALRTLRVQVQTSDREILETEAG